MEKTGETYTAWGIGKGVHETIGLKPMLTPDEQVAFLKEKGVAFERCGENTAIGILSNRGTFLHVASFRKLFQRYQGGSGDGLYVGLDFADLIYLDGLDGEVRHVFLMASQDIERLAKTKLITRMTDEGNEDGYGIVADFMASQQKRYRNAIESNLANRMNAEVEGDEYTGDLIRRYSDAMPVWVFMEVVTFGTLLSFYLFCAERWQDAEMREEHYMLKGVKTARNCCSHGSCIVNGLDKARESEYSLSEVVYDWLGRAGVRNSKTRRAKLRNRRVQQLLETLVMLDRLDVEKGCSSSRKAMVGLRSRLDEACGRYGGHNGFVSYLRFLGMLIDKAS